MSLHKSHKTEKREEAFDDLQRGIDALLAATHGIPSMIAEDAATPEQVRALFYLLAVDIACSKGNLEMRV